MLRRNLLIEKTAASNRFDIFLNITLISFISNQSISNKPSGGKLLSNVQDSTLFHQATIKATD